MKLHPDTAIDIDNERILGYELPEIAAVGMLDFMAIVDRQSGHPNRPKDYFKRNYATMERWVEGDPGGFAKWGPEAVNRKPSRIHREQIELQPQFSCR